MARKRAFQHAVLAAFSLILAGGSGMAAAAEGPPGGEGAERRDGGLPATGSCEPWPGEPSPLPTVQSPEELLRRWALLRVAELERLALELERERPLDAHRLWRHVACLDPGDEPAREGMQRTRPVRVHHPPVVEAWSARGPVERGDLGHALRLLDAPVAVVVAGPPPERERPQVAARPPEAAPSPSPAQPETRTEIALQQPGATRPRVKEGSADARGEAGARTPALSLSAADRLLAEVQRRVSEARFEDALARAREVREEIAALGPTRMADERRARLEVLTATALIGLGRDEAARESFERALAADPGLELDPQTTSPKVLSAFEAARAGREASR